MRLRRLPFALTAIALLTLVALAPVASAEHQQRYNRDEIARLAHQLDDAAYEADELSRYRSPGYHAVDAAFSRLSDAAEDFHRVVESGYDPYAAERAFDRVAERYYDLRWELRVFHGPDYVRAAYHRINAPMEVLYRLYNGRDLYRDYERLRLGRQPRQHQQAPRYNVPLPRHDDRGNRGNRGRGRGRGNGRH